MLSPVSSFFCPGFSRGVVLEFALLDVVQVDVTYLLISLCLLYYLTFLLSIALHVVTLLFGNLLLTLLFNCYWSLAIVRDFLFYSGLPPF